MSEPYVGKLKSDARHNTSFRHVLFTARQMQLVVMSLQPGEEIGTEVHEVDQLIYIVEGEAVKLFTVYAPPEHAPGTIHETKADAETGELAGSMSEIARA